MPIYRIDNKEPKGLHGPEVLNRKPAPKLLAPGPAARLILIFLTPHQSLPLDAGQGRLGYIVL